MGASASALPALSPKNQENEDIYDAFLQMKLEKMTDEEIYDTLKKKYDSSDVHKPKSRRSIFRPEHQLDSLRNVAFFHFSQTLETNRISFENERKRAKDTPIQSASCHKLNSHYSYSINPPRTVERVSLRGTGKSNDISALENCNAEGKESPCMTPPPKVKIPPKRPQLKVFVDVEMEGDVLVPIPQATDVVRTPRVDGRISPSGAVHVGKFAINELGLQSDWTGRRQTPHAFLTAGKSDFVEIGFLGSGATSSIIEALHIPTLTIVALKMLPTKDSADLQCISSELSVLYQNLAELRLIDGRLDEEETSDDEERSARQTLSSPCEQVLALYDGKILHRSPLLITSLTFMNLYHSIFRH